MFVCFFFSPLYFRENRTSSALFLWAAGVRRVRRPRRSVVLLSTGRRAAPHADGRGDGPYVQHHPGHHAADRVGRGRHSRPVQRTEHELGQRAYRCGHQLHDLWPHTDSAEENKRMMAQHAGRQYPWRLPVSLYGTPGKGLVSDSGRRRRRMSGNQQTCCQRKWRFIDRRTRTGAGNLGFLRFAGMWSDFLSLVIFLFFLFSKFENLLVHTMCVFECAK